MFVCSGCIISRFTANILEELSKIKVKKVLLGAGAYQYDDFDKRLSLQLVKQYDFIFTRDDISYSYFNGASNVYSGIDMAFFVNDALNNPVEKGNYALINIDLAKDNLDLIKKYEKVLKKHYKQYYIVENTTTKYADLKNFLFIGYWDNLYKTISHADFVVTNRIHTAVCCVSNCVAFKYVGYDNASMIGRSSLFSKFNFALEKEYTYTVEELCNMQDIINEKKLECFNTIKEVIV